MIEGIHPRELGLNAIGSLRPHSKHEGCWVGTMGDKAIVLWEGELADGTRSLVLFENPTATILLNTIQIEERA
jgi:hypothetical protein